MPTEAAFLTEIRTAPADPLPRLVYGDWLEERGDPRSDFVRAVVEGQPVEAVAPLADFVLPDGEFDPNYHAVADNSLDPPLWQQFTLDCAERVRPIYEEVIPDEPRVRRILRSARERGDVSQDDVQVLYRAWLDAMEWMHRKPIADVFDSSVDWLEAAAYAAQAAHSAGLAMQEPNSEMAGIGAAAAVTAIRSYASACSTPDRKECAASDAETRELRWQIVRMGEYKLWGRAIYLLPDEPEWLHQRT